MAGLAELLDVLPLCGSPPPIVPGVPAGIRYVIEPRPQFVEPPFACVETELAGAQAVVIAAPAAVGKSVLAEHLALKTGGVIWDLSQARVGNNYAIGTLATSHGPERLGDVLRQLQNDEFVVIADALDEARLRVTFDSFTAFLDDLARQVLKGVMAGSPSVVLLARRETADFAAEWLRDELDVRVARCEIEYFDRTGAEEFIRKQLEAEGKDPDNPAIVEARDIILRRTLELLKVPPDATDWSLSPARRFLGYAPVLVATARYLARGGNPRRIAEDLRGADASNLIWQFLIRLLDDLFDREHDKFVEGFRERFGVQANAAGLSDMEPLFQPQEQCDWLVSEVFGVTPPEVDVPPAVAAEYRGQVRTWMPEHPYVGASPREFASPVFEDYVYARILHDGATEAKAAVRARVADAAYLPTEMLARFFFAMSEGDVLDAADWSVLYESLLAAEAAGQRITLQMMSADDDQVGHHLGTLEIGDEDALSFEVATGGQDLTFLSKVSNARVFSDSRVRLGVAGRLLEVGPSVVLFAPTVEVLAESILVRGDRADGLNVFVTGSLTATDPNVKFVYGGECLAVRASEPLRFPFADKQAAIRWEFPLMPPDEPFARALFRLAGMFKTEGYEGLGSYAEPIDRLAARNDAVQAVLALALDRGVIVKDGAIYKFYPDALGLDFAAVRAHDLSPDGLEFVREAARRSRS